MNFDGDEEAKEFRTQGCARSCRRTGRIILAIRNCAIRIRGLPNQRRDHEAEWLARAELAQQWGGRVAPGRTVRAAGRNHRSGLPAERPDRLRSRRARHLHIWDLPSRKPHTCPRCSPAKSSGVRGSRNWTSGSDVNSLRTSATKDGNNYVIEGRKIWTTNAHFADMMFGLVKMKVGGKLQNGLTFILIDMHNPKVTVRRVPTIDGRWHINEVLLDEVRVPASNIVGEIGRGWTKCPLSPRQRTRAGRASSAILPNSGARQAVGSAEAGGWSTPDRRARGFRQRVTQAEIDLFALEFAVMRVLYASDGEATEGLPSVLKLRGADLRQRVSELAVEVLGDRGLIFQGGDTALLEDELPHFRDFASSVAGDYLFNLSASIAGGTSEIHATSLPVWLLDCSRRENFPTSHAMRPRATPGLGPLLAHGRCRAAVVAFAPPCRQP